MTTEREQAVERVRRRAHVHTDRCYGPYEPCGEHHAHDATCGCRPLCCRLANEPDLVEVIAALDEVTAELAREQKDHLDAIDRCSKAADEADASAAEVQMLREAIGAARFALFPWDESEVEHHIALHADDMPGNMRAMGKAIAEARSALASTETET
jgi:formate-dependent nitrite reductase cytochrome c552 subunit